jgi:Pyruvate/2-oxoacid:ferredoxin oxidoreductase delta subunit
MADVIDLKEKKQQEKTKKSAERRNRRMEMILQMFQCSRCSMRCMKCGSQIDLVEQSQQPSFVPYRFCRNCLEEYLEFLDRLHGRGNSEHYWYNQEWLEVWKAWMHYQDTLKRYELSDGFRRLLKELKDG